MYPVKIEREKNTLEMHKEIVKKGSSWGASAVIWERNFRCIFYRFYPKNADILLSFSVFSSQTYYIN